MIFILAVQIIDKNVKIDGRDIFFDQSVNKDIKTFENIRKIILGRGGNYTTGSYKLRAMDLSK